MSFGEDVTHAILEEAYKKASEPYSTSRKIQGYLRNKVQGGVRSAIGGSSDAKSIAKVVGRNAVSAAPLALGHAAGKIPVIGSYASTLLQKGSQLVTDKVVQKLDQRRTGELRAKSAAGTMTVKEMTEMIQREGSVKIIDADLFGKMNDAVRKVDTAYASAKDAIVKAKDCDSIYKAAKDYAYLRYRVVRLQYYIELIRAHLDEISAMNERYGAQIIGFEADLAELMTKWFDGAGSDFHKANCKNKDTCYYHQHGIA